MYIYPILVRMYVVGVWISPASLDGGLPAASSASEGVRLGDLWVTPG